ncbi:hypothetical protein [Micromonospora sp. CPCC 206061]|uniref:hypothetical protein n=1 Tax=Micromonospora sp. CPCC 206061 TaxID=3122410 RepID=UPI002FEE8532
MDSVTLPASGPPAQPTATAAIWEVLTPGKWWPLLVERAASCALILCAATSLVIWAEPASGPVDLARPLMIGACIAVLTAVMGLRWRPLWSRRQVHLTRAGIEVDGGLTPWSQIAAIDVVAAPGGGRYLDMRLHHGRSVRLWSLTGTYPLPDRALTANTAKLAAVAATYQPSVTIRSRHRAFVFSALAALLVIAGGSNRIVERGLIGPWTHTVPAATTACQVLDSVALHHGPWWLGHHTVTAGRDTYGTGTSCTWDTTRAPTPGGQGTPTLTRMTLRTTVHGWRQLRSPVAAAGRAHAIHLGNMPWARPLPYMPGSDVVIVLGRDSIAVYGQRANVSFSVSVDCNAHLTGCPPIAEFYATGIAYWALLGIGA